MLRMSTDEIISRTRLLENDIKVSVFRVTMEIFVLSEFATQFGVSFT